MKMDNIYMKCKCKNIIPMQRVNLGYKVCEIPTNFGCIAFEYNQDGEPTREGISEWFNYKGYTYIIEK